MSDNIRRGSELAPGARNSPPSEPPPPPPEPAGASHPDVLTGVSEALAVRPGDTLLVRVSTKVTTADAEGLKAALEKALPNIRSFVVRAEQLAVVRRQSGSPGEVSDEAHGR